MIAQPAGGADDITNVIEARYLGSSDAAWIIFAIATTDIFPSVLHISLHESGWKIDYADEDQAADRLQSSETTVLVESFT